MTEVVGAGCRRRAQRSLQMLATGAFLALLAMPAAARSAAAPIGTPRFETAPRDADFGVSTRNAALRRHVEMYQWRRAGSSYRKAWLADAVDSSDFAPGHDNPGPLPLQAHEWRARITLDGMPVPFDVIDAIGEWRAIRPDFSDLPGNLSATFQRDGDGLGSADEPLAPAIGDLRVRWQALRLPPLHDRLLLRDGSWTLAPGTAGAAVAGHRSTPAHLRWWWFGGAIVVVLAAALVARRRRRAHTNAQGDT